VKSKRIQAFHELKIANYFKQLDLKTALKTKNLFPFCSTSNYQRKKGDCNQRKNPTNPMKLYNSFPHSGKKLHTLLAFFYIPLIFLSHSRVSSKNQK